MFLLDSGTVLTVRFFSTLSEQFLKLIEKYLTLKTVPESNRKISQSEQFLNLIEKYLTVRTVPESNRKIPHCQNSS
jgi:hypothetical protein